MKENNSKTMSLKEFKEEYIPERFFKKESANRWVPWDPVQRGKDIVNEARKKAFQSL